MAKLCDLAVPCDKCFAPQTISCRLSDSWSEALRMNPAQLTNPDQVDRIAKESDITPSAVRAKIARMGNRRLDVRSEPVAATRCGVALGIRLNLTTPVPSPPSIRQYRTHRIPLSAKANPAFFFHYHKTQRHILFTSPFGESTSFRNQDFFFLDSPQGRDGDIRR